MLDKFIIAQDPIHLKAQHELEAGRKTSHWMWYIFPQLAGLGSSETSKYYSLANLKEAELYLRHPVLGTRLISMANILLKLPGQHAHEIFGSPDDMKLKSCMTLFSLVPGSDPAFSKVLEKYFDGQKDHKTLKILEDLNSGH